MATGATRHVARAALRALAARSAAECLGEPRLAVCTLRLRGRAVGTRAEDWRLVLTRPPDRREYQLGGPADWERCKRRARP